MTNFFVSKDYRKLIFKIIWIFFMEVVETTDQTNVDIFAKNPIIYS